MPYTQEHKARTRERIVGSARRLFNRHGLTGVSIDEIMADAGLTRGGFYNHFDTKEDLYAEVVQQVLACRKDAEDAASPPRFNDAGEFIAAYLSQVHFAATIAAR
jgi:AcrR family transcriptional regulator